MKEKYTRLVQVVEKERHLKVKEPKLRELWPIHRPTVLESLVLPKNTPPSVWYPITPQSLPLNH